MGILHDPFWQFIITSLITIAGIIIPLVVQSKRGDNSLSRGSGGYWVVPVIIVSIMLIIFVIFAGAIVGFASHILANFPMQNFATQNLTSSTPDQTLNTFCSDVQSGYYQGAYDEYSTHLMNQVTSTAFTQTWANQHLKSCTHGVINISGSQTTTTLTTDDFFTGEITNYSVSLIQDGSSGWKIDRMQRE